MGIVPVLQARVIRPVGVFRRLLVKFRVQGEDRNPKDVSVGSRSLRFVVPCPR